MITLSWLSHTTTPFTILIKTDSNLLRSNVKLSIVCSLYLLNFSDISLNAEYNSFTSLSFVFLLAWIVIVGIICMNSAIITTELRKLYQGVKKISSGEFGYTLDDKNVDKEVKELLEKEVEKKGVRIDSVKLEKEDNNLFLRIVIDRDEIIDIDTCVEVTNVINPILDTCELLNDSYILDVSTKEKGGKNE